MIAKSTNSIHTICNDFVPNNVAKSELGDIISLIQEDERVKLGYELHDGVNPLLVVANLYLTQVSARTDLEATCLERARSAIFGAIDNIRGLSSQLVVSHHMEYNLVVLLRKLVDTISGLNLFTIHFEHFPEDLFSGVDERTKLSLYRAVQESFNNIIKYSKASMVKLGLTCNDQRLRLTIADDGVGFDASRPATGIGLKNIEHRISQLNGQLAIRTAPGKGCLVKITVGFPRKPLPLKS